MNQIITSSSPIIRSNRRSIANQRQFSSSCKALLNQSNPTHSTPPKSRTRSSRLARRPGSDSVGQPDPISNLRPVRYGSAFESESSASTLTSSPTPTPIINASTTHPYSLSEFNSPLSSPASKLNPTSNFSRAPKPYSGYFLRLVEKLQEAELIHKLRRSRADSFNQRFWSDNNSRFQSDLSKFTSQSQVQGIGISPPSKSASTTSSCITTSSPNQSSQSSDLKPKSELEVDLAPFYSAWLSANSKRHQRYNQTLVRQIFKDLAPAARYQALRNWTGLVRKWEAFRSRGPG